MDSVVAILTSWPGIVLVAALVALFLFRKELSALLFRIRRIGKEGIDTFEAQQSAQAADVSKPIDEFLRSYDNPLIVDAEKRVSEDLKVKGLVSPADRERALIRALAATNVVMYFEHVYRTIWGSQVLLLRHVNSRAAGVNTTDLTSLYETAKAHHPQLYENYSFDAYLGFLQSFNLIQIGDGKAFITVAGREFLKFLVSTGRSGPMHG